MADILRRISNNLLANSGNSHNSTSSDHTNKTYASKDGNFASRAVNSLARIAVKQKLKNERGHKFEVRLLSEPTYCSQCDSIIWGLIGLACKHCNLSSHNKCLKLVEHCVVDRRKRRSSESEQQLEFCCERTEQQVECCADNAADPNAIRLSHQFAPKHFYKPKFCDHCGIMIKGLPVKPQGLECDSALGGCGMSVHRDCEELVCQTCSQRRAAAQERQRKAPLASWLDALSGATAASKLTDTAAQEPSSQQQQQQQTVGEDNARNWAKITIKDFDLVRLLGTGSFSKVYLAKLKLNRHHEKEFAIKVMKKTNLAVYSDPEGVFTEMRVLNMGRQYPFLTIAHCCFQSDERLYFVMEYVIGHDLRYYLNKQRKFTEKQTRFYAAELVLALRFLHRQGFVYRDLKLDNVMIDKHGHCKLLDFGMSKDIAKVSDMSTRTFCGTPSYISPEMIRELDYGTSVDWWALGVLMFEMLNNTPPFEAPDLDQLYRCIVQDEVKIPLWFSDEARSILDGLLTKDAHRRLGCNILEGCEQAIFEHPFFKFNTPTGDAHLWEEIEQMRLAPPCRPSPEDLDLARTGDPDGYEPVLTPIKEDQLRKISQTEFRGFSFYSDSFTSLM